MKPIEKLSLEEWLAALTMVLVMVLGGWQAALSLGSPAVRAIAVNWADFRQGQLTDALSKQLDQNLPLRSQLIGVANAAHYLLTGGAGDQVRLGRNGWLFSVEELQYFEAAAAHQQARLALLAKAVQTLKTRGITVLVALVPDKARVQAQQLPGGRYPAWYAGRYASARDTLQALGVNVVDLLPVLATGRLDAATYYRTDTHWNQLGAQRAAAAVAERVKALAPGLPASAFVTTTPASAQPLPGDLLRLMGLASMPDGLRPDADREATALTQKVAGIQATGLLDAVSVPAALVGTSYSLRANFHGYLQQALGVEVLNVARDGGGFLRSIKDYLADEAFRDSPPQLIVWELPERVLSPPLSAAEQQGLPL